MDQQKIGTFIAQRRKELGMTQTQLAEKLNITNRAVSKWETGKALPDASIMLALCAALRITVNDLLTGEVVSMDHYDQKMEETLLEMVKQKEARDRSLLAIEVVIGIVATVYYLTLVLLAGVLTMPDWLRITLILGGFIPFIISMLFALRIEQVAGYYACRKCGHRYVPTYKAVNLAMHMGRTRYMRCPACNKRSWQKKVLTKE